MSTIRVERAGDSRELAHNWDPQLPNVEPPLLLAKQRRRGSLRLRLGQEGPASFDQGALLEVLVGAALPVELVKLAGEQGLSALARMTVSELRRRAGLSEPAASRLVAAFSLGRRAELERLPERPCMRSPAKVWKQVAPQLRGLVRERFLVLLLDGKYRLRRIECVSEGTLTSSLVHPREVFGPAVRESAAALVAVHNHPSGDPEPSAEDLEVTTRLLEVGKLLGIPLLDHLVVGDERFVSLRQRMLWP